MSNCLKSLIAFTLLLFSASALAADNGFYTGFQAGLGLQNQSTGNIFPFGESMTGNRGLGGRVAFGYQVNHFFAIDGQYGFATRNIFSHVYQNDTDITGKVMLPISTLMDLYLKAGGAYVKQYRSIGADTDGIRPVYGLGINYDITPRTTTDLAWTRIIGGSGILDSDFIGVGMSYHFG